MASHRGPPFCPQLEMYEGFWPPGSGLRCGGSQAGLTCALTDLRPVQQSAHLKENKNPKNKRKKTKAIEREIQKTKPTEISIEVLVAPVVSSVGWSFIQKRQHCWVHPWSGHIQELTNECINGWTNKSLFLSLSLKISQ